MNKATARSEKATATAKAQETRASERATRESSRATRQVATAITKSTREIGRKPLRDTRFSNRLLCVWPRRRLWRFSRYLKTCAILILDLSGLFHAAQTRWETARLPLTNDCRNDDQRPNRPHSPAAARRAIGPRVRREPAAGHWSPTTAVRPRRRQHPAPGNRQLAPGDRQLAPGDRQLAPAVRATLRDRQIPAAGCWPPTTAPLPPRVQFRPVWSRICPFSSPSARFV